MLKSFFDFQIFFIIYKFTMNYISNLFPNCHNLSKGFSFFIMKWIHLFLSEYLLYIFVTNEIFKILFTQRKLYRSYYFIYIYIVYRNRTFILMKFVFFNFSVIKVYNFFYPVLYIYIYIYIYILF